MHAVTGVATALLSLAAAPQEPGTPVSPAPPPAATGASLPEVVRTLADRLHRRAGTLEAAQRELQDAARACADPAARHALLREAVSLAERHGRPDAAIAAVAELARHFRIDERTTAGAVLRGMLRRGEPALGVEIADLALRATIEAPSAPTGDHRTADADTLALALQGAVAAGDPWLQAMVSRRAGALVQLAGLDAQVAPAGLARRLRGGADLAGFPLRALAPQLPALRADEADLPCAQFDAARLLELAATAASPALRRAMQQQALCRAIDQLDRFPARAAELAPVVTRCTDALASDAGITRLQAGSGLEPEHWRIANGQWRLHDGVLRGACTGTENFATLRYRYGNVRSVLIRGGITSPDGCNFRCKVGEVNLLLNWEVAAENHLWLRGSRFVQAPPALQVGKEHSLLFVQAGNAVHVCIDDRHWWTAPDATLEGTITVYPALDSEIFVREILIEGQPVARATAPLGVLM